MAKKIYNRDKSELSAAAAKSEASESATSKNGVEKSPGKFRQFINFLGSGRVRFPAGIVLLLIGFFLLVVFISYFSTGTADQSLVHSYGIHGVADVMPGAKNAGSILGANVANAMIAQGVGIAAFIVVLWCFVIGWRFLSFRQVRLVSYTLVSLLSIVTLSLVADALTMSNPPFFFPVGGVFGLYINSLLVNVSGYPGMIIVNIIVVMLWATVCYNTLKRIYDRTKSIGSRIPIPRFLMKKTVDQEEESESEVENPKEEEEPEPEEPAEEAPFDVYPDKDEPKEDNADNYTDTPLTHAADDKKVEGVEKEGVIEVAPEIEMAKKIKVEAYDPTKDLSKFKFPPIDLLEDRASNINNVDIDEQEENKQRITETLNSYGIAIKRIDVCVGPTITLFEIVPADGVRIAKIKNLEDDIALSLAALGIRIIAPIPGRGTIGIEVPNKDPQTVSMRSVIGSKKYQESKMELPMALGCTIENKVYMADLTKMPHLLVAGATGQGKSVGLNAIITSLLYKKHPAELKFVLIDPKMVEFSPYSILEHHYLARIAGSEDDCIITDTKKVVATLNSLVQEMEDRYMLLRAAGERNVKDYNRKFVGRSLNPEKGHRYMPYIVVIVDEFSDLIMTAGKEVERPIVRIAQKARAVGIHMIIATQRPSTNVITGIIKANFPGRVAFRVTQMVDSRTIIDCSGAQQLVGKGDMLFQAGGMTDRVQCAFIDTPEVSAICEYIGEQVGYAQPYELPEYVPENGEEDGSSSASGGSLHDRDSLFEEAAAFIVASDTASTSSLQRRWQIGYNRAGRIMDQLEAAGIVGPAQGGKPRRVLVDSVQLAAILENSNDRG